MAFHKGPPPIPLAAIEELAGEKEALLRSDASADATCGVMGLICERSSAQSPNISEEGYGVDAGEKKEGAGETEESSPRKGVPVKFTLGVACLGLGERAEEERDVEYGIVETRSMVLMKLDSSIRRLLNFNQM